MLRRKISLLLVAFIFILSACSSVSVEEQIHTHLEEAVVLEDDFKSQQSEITDLEKREQEIYSQIIDLGMDDFDEITKLAQDAEVLINEREEKLNLEQESIGKAQAEFELIEDLISELEEATVKEKGEEMYHTMIERYTTYDELYSAYTTSLKLEKELYEMLQQEEIEQETLNEHIEKINSSYETILSSNDTFNELTIEYNNLKKEFYDAAEIEVSLEEA